MVTVTVEVTGEAVALIANRRPVAFMADVGMQDELEVLTVANVLVERALTEVVELLQLSSTVDSIVDINL